MLLYFTGVAKHFQIRSAQLQSLAVGRCRLMAEEFVLLLQELLPFNALFRLPKLSLGPFSYTRLFVGGELSQWLQLTFHEA